jgi:hypothetical protein
LVITDGFNAVLVVVFTTGQGFAGFVVPPLTVRGKVVVGLVISVEFLTRVVGEKLGCGSVADGQVTVPRTAGVHSVVVPSQFGRR